MNGAEGRWLDGRSLPAPIRAAVTWSLSLVIVVAAVVVFVRGAVAVSVVTVPIMIAILVSALVGPVGFWLRRHGWPASIAAMSGCVILLVVAGLAITVLTRALVSASGNIAEDLEKGAERIDQGTASSVNPDGLAQSVVDGLVSQAGSIASAIAGGVIHGVSTATELVAGSVLTLALVFYFIRDGQKLWAGLVSFIPSDRFRHQFEETSVRAYSAVSGYVRGATLIAAADAVLILVGLLILRVPNALALASLVFVAAYVPYIGAFLSGLCAVLVALGDRGLHIALWTLALVVAVQVFEGNVLQPWIQSKTVRLHPVLVLIALAVGTALGGLVGTLLAVPMAAVLAAIMVSIRSALAVSNASPSIARQGLDERNSFDQQKDAEQE